MVTGCVHPFPQAMSRLTIRHSLQAYPGWTHMMSPISRRSFHRSQCFSTEDPTPASLPKTPLLDEAKPLNLKTEEKRAGQKKRPLTIRLNIPVMNISDWGSLESINFDGSSRAESVSNTLKPTNVSKKKRKSSKDSQTSKKKLKPKIELPEKTLNWIFTDLRNDVVKLSKESGHSDNLPTHDDLREIFRPAVDALSSEDSTFIKRCNNLIGKLMRRSVIIYGKSVSDKVDPAVIKHIFRPVRLRPDSLISPISVFHYPGSPGFQWDHEVDRSAVEPGNSSSSPTPSSPPSRSIPIPQTKDPNGYCVNLPEGCPFILVLLTRPRIRRTYAGRFNSHVDISSNQTYAANDASTYYRFLLNPRSASALRQP